MDLTQPHILSYLDEVIGDTYRDYRCKALKKAYKKYILKEHRRHPKMSLKNIRITFVIFGVIRITRYIPRYMENIMVRLHA